MQSNGAKALSLATLALLALSLCPAMVWGQASETIGDGTMATGLEMSRRTEALAYDPEIGANDFQISYMGYPGDLELGGRIPAVAYNSRDNEYLVVWAGDEVDTELEIYGTRINAATGSFVDAGLGFRISTMGPDGTGEVWGAWEPAVAYNATDNEYLVVWKGDDDRCCVDDEFEIFGQRLAADGTEIGPDDFRISFMGPDGSTDYSAGSPAVAWESASNRYLVVWSGDDNTPGLVDGHFEIFGRLIDVIGGDTFLIGDQERISFMDYDGRQPDIVYNPIENQYLVVWMGDHDTGAGRRPRVYGQRIRIFGGFLFGAPLEISNPLTPELLFYLSTPSVAYGSAQNEYLVVWADGEVGDFEVLGQRLDAETGNAVGVNDFPITDMSLQSDFYYRPDVVHNQVANEYLVVFWDGTPEWDVYARRMDGTDGSLLGGVLQVSDMGPDGVFGYPAILPAVAHSTAQNEYLVAWEGIDSLNWLPGGYDEHEIFGQRLSFGMFLDGFESGNTSAWSQSVGE